MPNYDLLRQGLYEIPIKIENRKRRFTFFQNRLFGGTPVLSANSFIAMDYASLGVNILEEALRGTDPNRVNYGSAFNEELIYPHYYSVQDTVNFNNLENRVSMDEPINAPWTAETRAQYLAADKRDKMYFDLEATKEKLCHDVLFNGSFTTRGKGTQAYPMESSLFALDGSTMFTNPAGTIATAIKTIVTNGYRPVSLILNPDDSNTLATVSAWQKMLDNRRVEGNAIAYKPMEDDGLAYVGTISVQGGGQINIYTYLGVYETVSGSTKVSNPLIPRGKALIVPETVGCMGYAGLLRNDGSGYQKVEAMDVAYDIWPKEDGPRVQTMIEMQSSPAPIITALDGFGVLTNIPSSAS